MTEILSSVEIKSFRGIEDLKVNNLSNVNIITGNNNSGKTSFLEALMMLSAPNSLFNVIKVARLREAGKNFIPMIRNRLVSFQIFTYIFNKKYENANLSIKGTYGDSEIKLEIFGGIQKTLLDEYTIKELFENSIYGKNKYKEIEFLEEEVETFLGKQFFSKTDDKLFGGYEELNFNKYTLDEILRINRSQNTIFNYSFTSSIDHILNDSVNIIIKNIEFKKEVIEILGIFDSEIEDLVIIENDGRYIHCIKNKSNGLMPISMYGDGIKKVIALASGIIKSKNGVFLVDEIETSIHKKIMPQVFHWLIESSQRFSVQLFLTTHSIEVVDEILNSNPQALKNDLLRVVTLGRNSKNTVARVLSGKEALKLRENFDMELR